MTQSVSGIRQRDGLYKVKGKPDDARKCISDAIHLFEECEADVFLKRAKEALAALG
jgi:hypothetical protein